MKSVDEEGIIAEPCREVAVGASHRLEFLMFVVSEPGGRKAIRLVEPLRDCCVHA